MLESKYSRHCLRGMRAFAIGMMVLIGGGAVLGPGRVAAAASTSEYIDVTDYGAVGDGTDTNLANTTAIQNAINAAVAPGGPGCVLFPRPTAYYRTSAPLELKSGLTIRGVGQANGASTFVRIINSASNVFTQPATGCLSGTKIENLSITASGNDVLGGHVFALNNVGFMRIARCSISQYANNKAIMDIPATNGSLIECVFEENSFWVPVAATVPAFNLLSNVNSINLNTWRRNRFTTFGTYTPGAGSYCIHIESTSGNGYCNDNVIRETNFEQTVGGCVRLLSANNTEITQCAVYDMQVMGATTKDLFYVGRSGTTTCYSKYTKFSQVARRNGALGTNPDLVDIRLEAGHAPLTTIECSDTGTTGYKIDLGNNSQCTLLGEWSGITVSNVSVNSTTALRPGQLTGGNWVDSAVGGTSARKMPVYDATGTLLGYIPVYPN